MLIVQLAAILFAAKIAGDISVRLGQPAVLGKLLIGIVLGPSVLGIVQDTDILKEISQIGVILLMFIAGLETDIDQFKRTGKAATYVGVLGIVVPLALGYAAGVAIGLSMEKAVFLGLLLSATSVSISVQALKEMDQLKSKEGSAILGAAVIDDILVIIALAFLMSLTGSDVHLGAVILKKIIFFAVAILLAWKAVPVVLRLFAPLRVSESVISAALIICFVFAYFAEAAGVAAIIGAYIAGLAVSFTSYKQEVFEKIETIGYSIFVPVFFTSIGVAVEFSGALKHIWLMIGLSGLAVLTKLVGAALGAKLAGFSWNSSFAVGAGMVSRGEVALIIAGIGLETKLLTPDLFAVLVVVVLVTTIVTPPLLKAIFKGKQATEQAA
ncbi:cation:proton antiporter [Parageobacillus thermoglucosidasius]|uniref:cation:proton antiporter n=1 Tax=Parageobacillus thermoglucosidasius TaxID=1426 RepID=UPI0001D18482|nr:cation:proton antiporter [Parageobacillus thermoglucosidasius]REK54860.1 MAG: cation:proton antiporter [Geobacillus sp.]AEH48790.1 potassium efflux system protein [Parageobacillus thermoglucosidasius C56-YS93]MBY6269373.1 cation:proton antiporter [Parageobacillus thermoglucosidasius]OUM91231.1 MAG: sodium:proton antiporter [Parageobacillus thermoglucosidasius]RDE34241.1 cation:proton antiporter [Parageobacillus thermoglucosidasius]